jgi:hypothetical protein
MDFSHMVKHHIIGMNQNQRQDNDLECMQAKWICLPIYKRPAMC